MKRIILASKSPRRKELLEKLGLEFKIIESNYKEDLNLHSNPTKLVKHLALGKAEAVAKRHKNAIIIAADTLIVFNNKVLGKPKNVKDAVSMLKKLSGRTHLVFTGLAVIDASNNKKFVVSKNSEITFRGISLKEIKRYVATGEPMDKAGAYAMQERASVFVKSFKGDFTNVIGLPVPELIDILKKFNIKL